jgi:hypothetical protein
MNSRKVTLFAAAFAGALIAASAGAAGRDDRNASGAADSGDRGVTTPGNVEQVVRPIERIPSGQAVMPSKDTLHVPGQPDPRLNNVAPIVNNEGPGVVRSPQAGANVPAPRTPAGVNESAPARTGMDRTNERAPAPLVRGDNPNLPSPRTPSGVNESAPAKAGVDPTNSGGGVGATR